MDGYRALLACVLLGGLIPALAFMLMYRVRRGPDFAISLYLFGHSLSICLLYLRSFYLTINPHVPLPAPPVTDIIISISLGLLIDLMQWLLVVALITERRRARKAR